MNEFPHNKATEQVKSQDIKDAEVELGVLFTDDYKVFLKLFGYASPSAYPLYGLKQPQSGDKYWSVIEETKRFRDDEWPHVENWYIISEDLSGNPFGIDRQGKVVLWDHDFGGGEIISVADSFEEFIIKSVNEEI